MLLLHVSSFNLLNLAFLVDFKQLAFELFNINRMQPFGIHIMNSQFTQKPRFHSKLGDIEALSNDPITVRLVSPTKFNGSLPLEIGVHVMLLRAELG